MNVLPVKPWEQYTKAEMRFIDDMTRKIMVEWCKYYLHYGELPKDNGTGRLEVYFQYALLKKWISGSSLKVLSLGFQTAAAFLRR